MTVSLVHLPCPPSPDPPPSDVRRGLRRIARGFAADRGLAGPVPGHDRERTWVRLPTGPDVAAWLIRWPVGTSTGWHDHIGVDGRGVGGVFTVVEGELAESWWSGRSVVRRTLAAARCARSVRTTSTTSRRSAASGAVRARLLPDARLDAQLSDRRRARARPDRHRPPGRVVIRRRTAAGRASTSCWPRPAAGCAGSAPLEAAAELEAGRRACWSTSGRRRSGPPRARCTRRTGRWSIERNVLEWRLDPRSEARLEHRGVRAAGAGAVPGGLHVVAGGGRAAAARADPGDRRRRGVRGLAAAGLPVAATSTSSLGVPA